MVACAIAFKNHFLFLHQVFSECPCLLFQPLDGEPCRKDDGCIAEPPALQFLRQCRKGKHVVIFIPYLVHLVLLMGGADLVKFSFKLNHHAG